MYLFTTNKDWQAEKIKNPGAIVQVIKKILGLKHNATPTYGQA
jgi:hypothetical protein